MRNLWNVTKNILKRLFKQPGSYILHLLVPIMVSMGIFMVYSMWSSSAIGMALSDMDESETSAFLTRAIEDTGKFKIIKADEEAAARMVADGEAAFAYGIPEGFEQTVLSGGQPEIAVYAVGQNEGTGWIEAISNYQIQNIVDMAYGAGYDSGTLYDMLAGLDTGTVALKSRMVADVTREKETSANAIGMYMMLMMISSMTISLKILEEKQMGTFARIGVAPVNPKIYTLANVLANMLVATLQIAAVLTALTLFVHINFHMHPLMMFLIIWVFALCSVSLGLMLAAFAKRNDMAGTMVSLVVSPSCMLAGCFWPLSFMPDYMQKIAYITPQRWTLDAIINMQSGGGLAELMPSLAMVLAFTLLFFLLAAFRFKTTDKRLG